MKSPVERILPLRETSKDILTPSARILLSHNSSWSQGGCWGALLRRNALPQNCIGRRRPRPCCNPLRHLSQVEQLFCVNKIHSDQIHFSIFKKRKRTSFYPRLAIAYSLIVLIIIIRFSHCQYHRMKCNDISGFFSCKCNGNIQVLWLHGNKYFPKDVTGSQNQVPFSLFL